MRILVTGSSGFLGQQVVKDLGALKHYIIGVDKSSFDHYVDSIPNEFFTFDILDSIKWPGPAFDMCIHTASEVGGFIYNAQTDSLLEKEVKMIKTVARWCHDVGCQKFIYISSINVFETSQDYTHSKIKTHTQKTPYARAKTAGEEIVRKLFKEFLIIRPTNLFGARQLRRHGRVGESHVIPDLLHKIQMNEETLEVLGTGEQVRNFIHVSDVSKFIVGAAQEFYRGWYNLRSDISLSISTLAKELIKFKDVNRQINFQPQFMKFEKAPIEDFDLHCVTSCGWTSRVKDIGKGLCF